MDADSTVAPLLRRLIARADVVVFPSLADCLAAVGRRGQVAPAGPAAAAAGWARRVA